MVQRRILSLVFAASCCTTSIAQAPEIRRSDFPSASPTSKPFVSTPTINIFMKKVEPINGMGGGGMGEGGMGGMAMGGMAMGMGMGMGMGQMAMTEKERYLRTTE